MISANYVDGLELRIKEITAERNAALAREAELVAQVEALRNLFPLKNPLACEGFLSYPLSKYNEVVDAFNSTPQQHLRDIQAEAGRAGFVAGVQYAHKRPDTILPKVIEMVACDYAERVKAGEV